jgi:hypothetical protein
MSAVTIKVSVIFVPLKFKVEPTDKGKLSLPTQAFMKNDT